MDETVRITGWVGFGLGAVVLVSYAARWSAILESARSMPARVPWAVSASVTAISFVLLAVLWGLPGNNVTEDDEMARLFVVGLFGFMAGAICWPWVLDPNYLTPGELAALWLTASGCAVLVAASVSSAMAVPFSAVLLFHHAAVDGVWWPLRGRPGRMEGSVVHALYVWYFGPLAAAIPLVVFDCYTEAAAIVVTVTALHMVIGGLMVVLGYTDLQTRYTDTRAIVADIAVTGALVTAAISLSTTANILIPIGLGLAIVGNVGCVAASRQSSAIDLLGESFL